jgi:UDP-N-acetylmuramoylalanine--D-glutamate ligase
MHPHDPPPELPQEGAAATSAGGPRRALVLGLGESGLAMARWLDREGYAVVVADTRAAPPMLDALRAALPDTAVHTGSWPVELLDGVQLVALSPGLPPRAQPLASLLAEAARRHIETVGEIELFARALEKLRASAGYAPQLVGITGTNGKTTTVRMAGRMIEEAGRSVLVAGNVSPSALDALRDALDGQSLPEYWVLELSSFQLAGTRSLACAAAAVLNVTQDHLDWHVDFEEYRDCKQRIFGHGTTRIWNRDDPASRAMGGSEEVTISFGAGAPTAPGQYGLVRDGGLSWLACIEPQAAARKRRRVTRVAPDAPVPPPVEAEPLHVQRLMPIEALAVRGTHNAMNALAALALVRAVGIPLAPALRALANFVGEPHRTETVASIAGVDYVDDSKGTNVGATVAAIEGLAQGPEGPRSLVVILGGDGKGQSFAPLADAVRAHARAAVLIGKDGPAIGAALEGARVPLHAAEDLPAAVQAAAKLAHAGDIVLLSPACASFDAFRNYAHRAEVFVAAVRELAAAGRAPGAKQAEEGGVQ